MRLASAIIAIAIVVSPVAVLAQSSIFRPLVTHDELFGVQLDLPPSPSPPTQSANALPAGTRLNPPLGGSGNRRLGQVVTRQAGPASTNQTEGQDFGSHDDLQFTPQS